MIGNIDGYLVRLSLGLPLVYPIETLNTGAELHYMLLGASLGLCFGSEAIKC